MCIAAALSAVPRHPVWCAGRWKGLDVARDADTIQAEIERARDALAVTVDELAYRANPQRIANHGKQAALVKINQPNIKFTLIGVGLVVGALILRKLLR